MTAIPKTLAGIAVPGQIAQGLKTPVEGYVLLGTKQKIDQLVKIAAVFGRESHKEVYVPVDVDAYNCDELRSLQERALQGGITGFLLHGANTAYAADLLAADGLTVGCTFPMPSKQLHVEDAYVRLAERIKAGCNLLLIAPWVGEEAVNFLSDFAKEGGRELPPVFYGVMPVESQADVKRLESMGAVVPGYLKNALAQASEGEVGACTVDAELQGFEKVRQRVQGVYANCSYLQSPDTLAHLMNKLSIATGKQ